MITEISSSILMHLGIENSWKDLFRKCSVIIFKEGIYLWES